MGTKSLTFLAGVLLAAGCSREPDAPAPAAATPAPAAPTAAPAAATPKGRTIVAERGGFIPEGIEYDTTNRRFLSGSLAEGTIFQLHEDGRVTPVVTDPQLVSSVGIEVDEPRDRLLVANSDRAAFQPGNVGQAKLGVYNLASGERIAMVDLAAVIGTPPDPPQYFANDVTVDGDGNAYVTDTMTSVVYKVTADYQASVLHRFADVQRALNGIVHHAGGYLLVAAGQDLYKVPVANPAATTKVAVAQPVPGQDGIVWTADGRLAVTSNSADAPAVVLLASSDDWTSAQRAGVAALVGQATTAATVGNDVWAVHPHFGDAEPPSLEQAVFE
jgi:sugar lactone lactonase YvrE